MINKFIKFNNEKLFEQINDNVKILMLDIHKELNSIDKLDYYLNFNDKYGFETNIHITSEKINTICVYHAQTSIKDIIQSNFKKIDIEIYIEDYSPNINKIYSLLAHEFSHYYQLLSGEDIYFNSFNKMINIENFKNEVKKYKNDFLDYIYYNFQHELDARIDQTYEGYLYSELNSVEEMINEFKNSGLSKILEYLFNFNSEDMINKYNNIELLKLTNQFNKLYDIDQIDIFKLNTYYKNWETIFKKNSIEYVEKSENVIKQAFKKEKRYESYKSYCYDEQPLYEYYKYNMEDEIKNLVSKFKKLKL